MFFDVNVSNRCPRGDLDVLKELGWDGICINTVVGLDNLEGWSSPLLDVWKDEKAYERIEVRYKDNEKWSEVRKMVNPDVLSVRIEGVEDFKKALEVSPDVITFDYSRSFCLGKDEVFEAVKRNIFLEIPLVCGMYGQRNKVVWMRNARKLVEITGGVNVVVGSGASCCTEMRSSHDIIKILGGLGTSGDCGRKILQNSGRLIRSCRIRKGCVMKEEI
ncbi:uncharacterized protein Eint_081200 [Encephalitozoon intestinalis ATCC 50506]|uniref:Uncharacterized protein n=1 Tax=Encephalitozoon intestinalis (strain ATCC 50506) TaxID=876142 RepID=E0S8T5_ENCIT|nr:uncharacterized protein Eint_081200 [Encephalitozoon intestinalis ATCC 50506]ADM12052.1 hypothetical protein Eint_081200 [Encephalitozoon intestinalis ATCC 50506]UTX45842.1 ribonuclease P/MRP protein subunit RPP1 [Encephalitozoon intestinalis]